MVHEVPLCMAPEGKKLRVLAIRAGRGLKRRLIELGFGENAFITIVKSQFRGPLIVQINNSRFALGRGMAMKIMVEEFNPDRVIKNGRYMSKVKQHGQDH